MSCTADWFRENKLTLNLSKTKLMLFGTPYYLGKFKNISLVYDSEEIEKADNFKYICLIFDSNMTWSHHIDLIASSVSKHCGVICHVKCYLPNFILKKLAESLVMPHFNYCCHVWSNCSVTLSSRLQVLMNNPARIILSADIRTSINSMMSNLKWLKLDQRWNNMILVIQMSYWKLFMNTVHDYCTRGNSSNKLVVPHSKSNSGLRTFHVRATNLWNNSVDSNTRSNFDSMSLGQFKCTLQSNWFVFLL